MTIASLPKTQYAVQLIGPSQLRLNTAKEVVAPGPHQVLAKIEAVGLCFSDLKLLKQFSEHARKSEVVSGLAKEILAEIPSYVPGDKPGVPGHEAVCRIVAVGEKVKHYKVGERCVVQTDYRTVLTAASNAAFGYNFEGGLQEYVILDERVIMDPLSGERFLIPVGEELGASSVALVEPWACVEDSYVTPERNAIKANGRLLVVADAGHEVKGLGRSLSAEGLPAGVTCVCAEASQCEAVRALRAATACAAEIAVLPNEGFDDIVYFGAEKAAIELLNDKLAAHGLMNVVLGGKKIGEPVSVGVGRIHYGMTRWTGTPGEDAAQSYGAIPKDGEARDGDSILVIGAGGPMGQMHVLRDVCAGKRNVTITASDIDEARLKSLFQKAEPLAKANGVRLRMHNPKARALSEKCTYFALMAPLGALLAQCVEESAPGAIINVFAGIPAPTRQDLNLDLYIANRCYMIGTSGSTIRDMRIVLRKIAEGRLDTDASVDAISGMAGAIEGIGAVANRTLAGKIIVYPMLHDLGLIPLERLDERFPSVAAKLKNGQWNRDAEAELLRVGSGSYRA